MTSQSDLLARNHTALESALYAAEQICHSASGGNFRFCPPFCKIYSSCPFSGIPKPLPYIAMGTSKLFLIRNILGNPVKQDHIDTHAYTGPCGFEEHEEGTGKTRCRRVGHKDCLDCRVDGDSGIRYCQRKG